MALCLHSIPIISLLYLFELLHDIPRTVGVDTFTKDDLYERDIPRIWTT
jgi:hypothetical protein